MIFDLTYLSLKIWKHIICEIKAIDINYELIAIFILFITMVIQMNELMIQRKWIKQQTSDSREVINETSKQTRALVTSNHINNMSNYLDATNAIIKSQTKLYKIRTAIRLNAYKEREKENILKNIKELEDIKDKVKTLYI